MQLKDFTNANRAAWNEISQRHREQRGEELMRLFSTRGASCLDSYETSRLQRLGLAGRRVVQLCCNNGRELISIKNLGAARCVGIDISDTALEEARALATRAGVECEFVAADVYDVADQYERSFDLVYITVGALGWMPDINRFFQVVRRLMADQSALFIYEMHPLTDMFLPGSPDPVAFAHPYTRTAPYVGEGLDYYAGTEHKTQVSEFWFHHTLGAIVTAVAHSGIRVVSLEEFDHDVSNSFGAIEKVENRPPLSYILQGGVYDGSL